MKKKFAIFNRFKMAAEKWRKWGFLLIYHRIRVKHGFRGFFGSRKTNPASVCPKTDENPKWRHQNGVKKGFFLIYHRIRMKLGFRGFFGSRKTNPASVFPKPHENLKWWHKNGGKRVILAHFLLLFLNERENNSSPPSLCRRYSAVHL